MSPRDIVDHAEATAPATAALSRRHFLGAAGVLGAGLVLGFRLPQRGRFAAGAAADGLDVAGMLHIAPDGAVRLLVDRSEMGQGVLTALPMLVAEELDADWSTVTASHMPVDAEHRIAHPFHRVTGGSSSVRQAWLPLRTVGAQARAMLVAAAATRLGVPERELRTENGRVLHAASGRSLTYGELAVAAGALPVPEKPRLKDRSEFRIVGKPHKRLDTRAKVNGTATYGVDVRVPGMLTAVIARRATMGGRPVKVDTSRARAVPGVRRIVELPDGVAVVADGYWAARKGADALVVQWSAPADRRLDSAEIDRRMRAAAAAAGIEAHKAGDPSIAPATRVAATYSVPFLAHATMEPMNATAHVTADGVTIWAPTQAQSWLVPAVAKELEVDPTTITVHTTMLGGGFGRKAESDFVLDAVRVSKLVGAPVQVLRSRPDDMRHDFYRPASRYVVEGGLDAEGWPVLWSHHVAGHWSGLKRLIPQAVPPSGVDPDHVAGLTAEDFPYSIPNVRVTYAEAESAMPTGFWRSVGHSGTAFAIESFVDELAAAAGKDPVVVRRRLLQRNPRMLATMELAVAKSGWGAPLPGGRARGIACVFCFGSYVAQVAEVSVVQGKVKVHRVTCAIDCGEVVNPEIVRGQMESGVVYGLTAALHGEVTVADGNVRQASFNDYRVMRINEMPVIETHLVPSSEVPSGVGELGTPPIAPAVANAIFAATGKRLRDLPLRMPAPKVAAKPE